MGSLEECRQGSASLSANQPSMARTSNESPQGDLVALCMDSFCTVSKYSERSERLASCGKPLIELLRRMSNAVQHREVDFELVVRRLNDLIEMATEKFYAYPFKDVPACWRELFREASMVKVSALAVKSMWGKPPRDGQATPQLGADLMDEMVKTMDMALIMAGPSSEASMRETFESILELLGRCQSQPNADQEPSAKRQKLTVHDEFPSSSSFMPPVSHPIRRVKQPPFDKFESHMLQPINHDLGPEPLIITSALESWPARNERSWNNPSYLMSRTIGGRRLVPIETGRSYVDEGWGQKIITFKEFMDQYILIDPKSSHLASGYLAQHDLFGQIPSLRLDIAVPDYCYTSPPPPHHTSPLAAKHSQLPQLEDPLLNAWFGPAGTISPLHTDPYHNILAQVVGKKYVRLYAPRESEKLYARGVEDGGIDMGNTSAMDIGVLTGWDGTNEEQEEAHKTFPLFRDAEFVDCILEEGECLYIPVGWWHYVRSLSVSFSVSFWFN